MYKNLLPKKGKITIVFVTILLLTTLISSLLPNATATPVEIVSVTPESGQVGDVVRVIGQIDTTNGPYTIFFDEEKVKNGTAVETMVNDTFNVPPRQTGSYDITLHDITTTNNATAEFTVIEIIVYCQTRNKYDQKPLANVSVDVYVNTTHITSGNTNETGWTNFRLDRGNYTFKAFWNEELVGSINGSVTGNVTDYMLERTFYIECELAHITIAVNDEAGNPLPFINVDLTSSKPETLLFETNSTGIIATNAFTNVSYTIESRRYGYLFDTTLIENLTYTRDGKDRINITCPTYNLFVYVLDSKEHALKNVEVTVYEWSSERIVGSGFTDSDFGSVAFNCTFGRYKIKVYSTEWGHKVVLNETELDLIEDPFFFAVHSRISNLDPSVKVVDYFGQPIPNAQVKLERKFDEEYVNVANLTTESDGTVPLPKIGGDYRISVQVMGEYCEVRPLYLSESKAIEFKINKYVTVGGYPLQIAQLITYTSLALLITTFALAIAYRRLRKTIKKEKTSPKD
ncbi:hypothetical protein E3J49_08900 [Candidatus Bathyarchaeota archaeon]|nr:MAG: hypothetical protein E3J49_08900 [Candidatus Bathyarchaeota archaeon]